MHSQYRQGLFEIKKVMIGRKGLRPLVLALDLFLQRPTTTLAFVTVPNVLTMSAGLRKSTRKRSGSTMSQNVDKDSEFTIRPRRKAVRRKKKPFLDSEPRSCMGVGEKVHEKKSRGNTKANTASSSPPRGKGVKPGGSSQSNIGIQVFSKDVATISPENLWIDLNIPPEELRPSATLTTGQCFNWIVVQESILGPISREKSSNSPGDGESLSSINSKRKSAWGTHNAIEWVGPLGDRILSIKETPKTTMFRVIHGRPDGAEESLRDYFQLGTPLSPLYKIWGLNDARLARIAARIPGLRILRQDPVECLFSFICSSNNNIPRITLMLSRLREKYGNFLLDIPGRVTESDGRCGDEKHLKLFSFPTLESLGGATDIDLRDMGLGYRAKYIIETRDLLAESGMCSKLLTEVVVISYKWHNF